jgi:hypothetical protein
VRRLLAGYPNLKFRSALPHGERLADARSEITAALLIFRKSNHLDKLDRLQMNYILPCMNESNGAGTIITSMVSLCRPISEYVFDSCAKVMKS